MTNTEQTITAAFRKILFHENTLDISKVANSTYLYEMETKDGEYKIFNEDDMVKLAETL